MRVGIDYRILAVGEQLIQRGMGRYTQQQLRALLQVDAENTYVLLCEQDADLSLIDPAIRRAANVVVRNGPETTGDPLSLRSAAEYEDWIDALGIDVYHATTPFLFVEPVLSDFSVCPVVTTFYDLIPLFYPEHYLGAGAGYECYLWALGLVLNANRLLSISEASGADARTHLGRAADRIDVAWPIADDCFRVLPPGQISESLASLRGRIRVPEQFVLTVTYPHYSKNLEALFHAYASLPAGMRLRMPLVVCCHLPPKARAELRGLAQALGFADDLLLTGLVSDEALVGLYNAATMVVHPSRYEGFGLPVVEAMRCGTPVVTTTSSSLPEVGGDAALLVDPDDIAGMAEAIQNVFEDPDLQRDMADRGLRHAQRFNAGQLATATLGCYRRALSPPGAESNSATARLALWTPLPPQQSGIADYSTELLEGLGSVADVEAFVDEGVVPPVDLAWAHRISSHRAWPRRRRHCAFDVAIYEFGASTYHLYMYEALQRDPGIVVLHDFRWGYVLWSEAVRSGTTEAFRTELAAQEGDEALAELDEADDQYWNRHPMLGRVADASLALAVHCDAARRELELRYPQARAFTVPMGVSDPFAGTTPPDRDTARAALGLADSTFVVGAFGIVHPAKHLETTIDAFAELLAERPDSLLLVVGRALDPAYERTLAERARSLDVLHAVRFTGHLPTTGLDLHLLAADVVVNLRDAELRQVSAVLQRTAPAGRAAVITDNPWWAEYPDAACERVPNGPGEATAASDALRRLADDTEARTTMAAAARAHFKATSTIAHMTEGYLDVIEAVVGRRPQGGGARSMLGADVRRRLLSQAAL
jgi:glycosyltransferase involved in cell wall biosynthesis